MKTSDEHLNEALKAALKRKFDTFGEEPAPGSLEKILAALPARKNWKYLFLTLGLLLGSVVGIIVDQKINFSKSVANTARALPAQQMNIVHHALYQTPLPVANAHRKGRNQIPKVTKPAEQKSVQMELQETKAQPIESLSMEIAQPATTQVEPLAPGDPAFGSMQLPDISANEIPVIERINAFDQTKIKWLFHASVLQGYQILTVPEAAAHSYQNFKMPQAFSLQSAGFKIGVGIEKIGFQLNANYTNVRHRYSFEVAGNEYVLRDLGQNSYQLVRPGEQVDVEEKTNWLSVGISRQLLWGRSAVSRYYAQAGMEYARAAETGQQTGYVNAALGKQFLLNRKIAAEIGPFAEVSAFRLRSDQGPFYSQPYRVGIRLGIKVLR